MAPVVRARKGEYSKLIDDFRKSGYARIRLDGEMHELDEEFDIEKNKKHDIEVVVDRLVVREEARSRLNDSCETALKLADGLLLVQVQIPREDENGERVFDESEVLFSQKLSCPMCGISVEDLSPRMFSFNNPFGACPDCSGLGFHTYVDPDLCVQYPDRSINEGCITTAGWKFDDPKSWGRAFIEALADRYKFSLDTPWNKLPKKIQDELKIALVIFTEEIGGEIFLYFDDEGGLSIATDYKENDFLYDEIGSGLKVNQLRNEKRELFEQLEEYYELLDMLNKK